MSDGMAAAKTTQAEGEPVNWEEIAAKRLKEIDRQDAEIGDLRRQLEQLRGRK
jgi:hypothetical protein